MKNIKTRWLASLSNGETAIEDKPPFENIPNEPSAWLKLLRYLAENKLSITSLRVQVEIDNQPIRTFHLPSKSPKQRWAQLKPLLPIGFNYFRRAELVMKTETGINGLHPAKEDHFLEIHAYYPEYTLVLIIDEDTGNECWSLILTKE